MLHTKFASTFAILLIPSVVGAQSADPGAKTQSGWLYANFAAGLSECAVVRDGNRFSITGAAQASLGDGLSGTDGFNVSVAVRGAAPLVTAQAINTKGTGATFNRPPTQSCDLVSRQRETVRPSRKDRSGKVGARKASGEVLGATSQSVISAGPVSGIAGGAVAGIVIASCSVSGAPDKPTLRFDLPVGLLNGGKAKSYGGHVTLIRTTAEALLVSKFLSRKGYDYYSAKSDLSSAKAQSNPDLTEMAIVTTCDGSGLSANGSSAEDVWALAVQTNPYFVSNELAGEMTE